MSRTDEEIDATPQAARKRGLLQKDTAYERIKEHFFQVDNCETIFSERSLSKTLNLGLASVRSAVDRLRLQGIIISIPKGGIWLPEITYQEVIDFYEMRLVIESHVVARITGRLSTARCDELKSLTARQKEAAMNGDTLTYHQLDLDFHDMLARFHGNSEMVRALSQMRDKMHRLSRRLHRAHPERLDVNAEQHSVIVEAICTGDVPAATEAMRTHLAWGRDFTLDPDGRIA